MVEVFNEFEMIWVVIGGMVNYLLVFDLMKIGLIGKDV